MKTIARGYFYAHPHAQCANHIRELCAHKYKKLTKTWSSFCDFVVKTCKKYEN